MSEEEGKLHDDNVLESDSGSHVRAISQFEEKKEVSDAHKSETSLGDFDDDEEEDEDEEEEEEEDEDEEEEDFVEDERFLDACIVEDVNEAFQLFDLEDEDFINPKKLFSALRMLGYNPTEAEVQDLIESVDRDGNGEISSEEFMVMMRKRWNDNLIEENAREAFCVFDADENDIISADDIASLFTRLGHNLTQNQLEQIIAAADLDGDGAVTFDDFLTVFHKRPRDSFRASRTASSAQEELKPVDIRSSRTISAQDEAKLLAARRESRKPSLQGNSAGQKNVVGGPEMISAQDEAKLSAARRESRKPSLQVPK